MPDITITLTSAMNTRTLNAFGTYLHTRDGSDNPRAATNAEVKSWLARQLSSIVERNERSVAEAAISITALETS